jgi:hypothetical protein
LLLTDKIERETELSLQLIVSGARNQNAARVAELLQPRSDIDSVTEQVVPFRDNVAEIHPDPKDNSLLCRNVSLTPTNAALHCDCTRNSIDHRSEGHDQAVTHQLDDPAFVLGDERVDDVGAEFS